MAGLARCAAVLTLLLGLVLLIITISGRHPLISFIHNTIKQQVMILPGSVTYDNWRIPPVPVFDDIYIFNITNPTEFNGGAKAVVERVGPFVYRKRLEKRAVNFTGDLVYAMFYDYEDFLFDAEETRKRNSKWSLQDRVFIPNVPLAGAVAQIESRKMSEQLKKLIVDLIETYDTTHGRNYTTLNGTVEEILWGMDDPIMNILYKFKLTPSPRFALQTNGSTDPDAMVRPTVIYTGHSDLSLLATYHRYHGKNSSGCWGSHAANHINGSEGTMFEPLVDKTRPATIYNEQLFRSIDLSYTADSSFASIPCYHYELPQWALQNVTYNPINAAYYAYIYTGMLNLTQCASNVPLWISKSMFLDSDLRVRDNVTMERGPDKKLDETYICIEPNTGAVINGHKRVQINIQLQQFNVIGALNHVYPSFVPLIAVDEHGSITPELAAKLRSTLLTPLTAVYYGYWVLIAVGGILTLAGTIWHATIIRNKYRTGGDEEDDNSVLVNAEVKSEQSDSPDQYLSFDGRGADQSRYLDIE